MHQKQLSHFIDNNQSTASKNKYSISPNNPKIRNPSFSFFPNDAQFYQNKSASNPFRFNNCTVHFHMNNQVQNVSSSAGNSRKRRRIIYSSDSPQEKLIIKKTVSLCFLLNTDSCHWTIKFLVNIFYWCWDFMLQFYISHFTLLWFFKVLENFAVDFKKNKNIFMKAVVSQNIMFYLPCRFCGWVKAFKLVSVFSYVFLIFQEFTKK